MRNNQIILFDTSIGSFNMGDSIIVKSFKKSGADVLTDIYANFSTHLPNFEFWQMTKTNGRYRAVSEATKNLL